MDFERIAPLILLAAIYLFRTIRNIRKDAAKKTAMPPGEGERMPGRAAPSGGRPAQRPVQKPVERRQASGAPPARPGASGRSPERTNVPIPRQQQPMGGGRAAGVPERSYTPRPGIPSQAPPVSGKNIPTPEEQWWNEPMREVPRELSEEQLGGLPEEVRRAREQHRAAETAEASRRQAASRQATLPDDEFEAEKPFDLRDAIIKAAILERRAF